MELQNSTLAIQSSEGDRGKGRRGEDSIGGKRSEAKERERERETPADPEPEGGCREGKESWSRSAAAAVAAGGRLCCPPECGAHRSLSRAAAPWRSLLCLCGAEPQQQDVVFLVWLDSGGAAGPDRAPKSCRAAPAVSGWVSGHAGHPFSLSAGVESVLPVSRCWASGPTPIPHSRSQPPCHVAQSGDGSPRTGPIAWGTGADAGKHAR